MVAAHPAPLALRRVAVLRALNLGDLLCAVPALRALRAALPDAEIVLVGLPWARAFVDRFHRYLDDLLELPGWPGLPERPVRPPEIAAFLIAAQERRFDLVIQMHGSGSGTNPLAVLLGGRATAGFYLPGEFCPDPDRFLPYPARDHEIWRHLRLMERLGVPIEGDHLEFPLDERDRAALHAIDEARDLRPGEYVCIHPGAGADARRWPPERFAVVADALAARGSRVVLTGSSGERDVTAAVARAMQAPCLDLAGRTDLGALGALVDGARLLVSNDTGVMHVAAALGVPTVAVSTEPGPERWAPLDRRRHRFLCGGRSVSPATVIAQADELDAGRIAVAP
jgi:ADP-heptose:LPS heptosyltransferase